MGFKNSEENEHQNDNSIQLKSWQDGSGGNSGINNNNSPGNNDGFTDNSNSAKEALQLQKMAESSEDYIQMKKWADSINPDDEQPSNNTIQKKENKTGLPDNLKSGMENLTGHSLDDVKVHRNSEKPAQMQAHAYAQGTDIHLGPGQDKHLPHELGHVVQQKDGNVKPTTQQNGQDVNDDKGLEKNADALGNQALKPTTQLKSQDSNSNNSISNLSNVIQQWRIEDAQKNQNNTIQKQIIQKTDASDVEDTADDVEDTVDAVEEGVDSVEEGVDTVEEGIDTAEEKVEEGKAAVEDGKAAVEEAKNTDIEGELAKINLGKTIKKEPILTVPGFSIVPYLTWGITLKPSGALNTVDGEVENAEITVIPTAKIEAGVDASLGDGSSKHLKLGLKANASAEIEGTPITWKKDFGLKGQGLFTGALTAKIEAYCKFFDLIDLSKPVFNMHVANFSVTLQDHKVTDHEFDWIWNPGEDDLIQTAGLIEWLREDNEAANKVAEMSQADIDALPSKVKALLIAQIRDAVVLTDHEDQILKLLGLVEGNNTNINQEIWLVIQEAYANDHNGQQPSGYKDVYDWLHTKMNGENKETMEDSVDSEAYFDLLLNAELGEEDSNGYPAIKLTKLNSNSLGKKISKEDQQYIIGLVRSKDFGTIFNAIINCPSGQQVHTSLSINFAQGKFTSFETNMNSTVPNYDAVDISSSLDSCKINF